MNFMSFITKFIKFKLIIKFKKFELRNYGSQFFLADVIETVSQSECLPTALVKQVM